MKTKLGYKNGPHGPEARHPDGLKRFAEIRIRFLVPAEQILNPQNCEYDVMLVSFASAIIKRVCCATL